MEFPSQYLGEAVKQLSQLPGIGKKTALRLVLHILNLPESTVSGLAQSLIQLKTSLLRCSRCNNISDTQICSICQNPRRIQNQICVVSDIRDVLVIEQTNHYHGLYHILGGILDPLAGIGPDKLFIEHLLQRCQTEPIQEIILALNSDLEGDTTALYVATKVRQVSLDIRISNLARGVAFGAPLEYVDEITLARALQQRTDYLLPLSNS
ncbi:MAG: recombination mediator RecR [Bacteroidia bacterium]|nr:recombination mediator RecR [Bacteroidia bacterium]